jgi:hypothetical protein
MIKLAPLSLNLTKLVCKEFKEEIKRGELTVNLYVQCLQTKYNKVDFCYIII